MRRTTLLRLAVFVATTVAAWGVLAYGGDREDPDELEVGEIAAQDYEVVAAGPVLDVARYEDAQQAAREAVDPVTEPRPDIEEQVIENIEGFFADVTLAVRGELSSGEPPSSSPPSDVDTTTTTPTETTTTTAAPSDEEPTDTTVPATTIPPGEVLVQGFVYVDADGNGEFDPELPEDSGPGAVADEPLPAVSVSFQSPLRAARTETQSDGTFGATVTEGNVSVSVDVDDPDFPDFSVSAGDLEQTVECPAGETCELEPIGLDPNLVPVDGVVATIGPRTLVPDESIAALAAVAREDVVRTAAGGPSHLAVVQQQAIGLAQTLFGQRIHETPIETGVLLEDARIRASEQPPLVYYTDTGQRDVAAGQAAGDIVANFLLANWAVDEDATAQRAEEAAAAVDPSDYERVYSVGEVIADQGEPLSQLQIDAIRQTTGLFDRVQRQGGLLAVLAILSATLALYLNRFRPEFWARPRMVALLGILIVLAAGAVRGTVAFADSASWYVMPAVAFGLMTTVLFDSRIGVLMALSVAILTAVGTRDPGITVYALLATMAPIGFVSSVSTRRAFRNAAVYSGVAAAAIAAATSWFFHTGPDEDMLMTVGQSVGWAFGVSLVAALFGLALLQFFESAFDITTTLALLDLTDRNHAALQLLQEKAFGTFNHSLMVGTLADAAARSIGADPLLARASAYYHDIGKTENPTMFIENQFGIANPHDEMSPEESAEVIRRHVTDGIKLAKRFDIPSEVAEAIVSHHGDGIMRFFYEKARETDPGADPSAYRHVGHKPRTATTAIVMLADSLEASCRAVFQHEEPTPDAIEKVVNRVIDEKLNDGQLSESPLTLAQLTQMRKAFLSSLVGHYHQRIAYPNFPGS
ncbi:MAG TPA: HDIG domain-containing protein [Acidimicrobiia bacterium]|nr:HDIG domain-containing protein [Acidimicrobiia bacterium]